MIIPAGQRNVLLVILLCVTTLVQAQEVKKGELKDSLHSTMSGEQKEYSHESPVTPIVDIKPTEPSAAGLPAINPRALELKPEMRNLIGWKNGAVMGYHGSYSTLFSYRNVAGATAIQQFGNLTMTGGLSLSKGIGNGVGVVNDFGGRLSASYRLSDNFSISAFGGMNQSGFLGPVPDASAYYYGGYLTMLTNNHKWGMDVGVRRVYNSMSGQWETIPIAMPYYNLNGARIGIDVGGLLYSIFSSAATGANQQDFKVPNDGRGPAIIAPPIDTKVKLNPIETPKWVEKQYERQ